ncbi:myo-inositol-1(or 4)-monophosphatase [Alteribacillus persepolensis]|uniref:Myo-inositol-1(Or 4)-monophosphatase n=1 Tax=Alteribacillus persepolensis TaxID=568899 RepID=A0A1G7YA46_9BACI|nr:inositol monophosphatase [Alteribacillus persepolensis]SDG93321.1 myo-inositol-1(or 4)-monophosphatase [Alteribacillus persepolensis]
MSENWAQMKELAVEWMMHAGAMLKESLHDVIAVETKSNPNDLVTEMDYKVERYLTEQILRTYPSHHVLGEEEAGKDIQSTDGIVWIIDPIDGTTNFVHQKFNFAISVGVIKDGVGQIGIVYNVMQGEWFTAVLGEGAYLNGQKLPPVTETTLPEAVIGMNGRWLAREKRSGEQSLHTMVRRSRSVRSYGSAAIELAYVACGRLDSYISFHLSPWDYAAGLVLLNEVGVDVTDFQGQRPSFIRRSRILAARPGLHKELLSYVYNHEGFLK